MTRAHLTLETFPVDLWSVRDSQLRISSSVQSKRNNIFAHKNFSTGSMIHSNILSTALVVCFPMEERGILNKILYGKAPPRGPAPHSFYTRVYHF